MRPGPEPCPGPGGPAAGRRAGEAEPVCAAQPEAAGAGRAIVGGGRGTAERGGVGGSHGGGDGGGQRSVDTPWGTL